MESTKFPRVGCLRRLIVRSVPGRTRMVLPRLRALSFVERKEGLILCKGPKAKGARVTATLKVGTYRRSFAMLFASIPILLARVERTGSTGALEALRLEFRGCSLIVYSRFKCIDYSGRKKRLLFGRLSLETKGGTAVVAAGLTFGE